MSPIRHFMAAPLRHGRGATAPSDPAARPPAPADLEALAQLVLDAYQGTIDDEGETLEDAQATIAQLFGGEFGTLLWACSEVVQHDGRLVAATMITLYAGAPFVAFTMTHPAWQRRGLARAGLQRAMARLAAGDETLLRLVVSEGNPAEQLYASLGFVRCPDPREDAAPGAAPGAAPAQPDDDDFTTA